MLLQIYPPSLSLRVWVAHHCFRSRNSATILAYLLTINTLDCVIKADAWARSLELWSVQMGPALPNVCGGHWCYSPNIPSLTTLEAWQVVLPDFFCIWVGPCKFWAICSGCTPFSSDVLLLGWNVYLPTRAYPGISFPSATVIDNILHCHLGPREPQPGPFIDRQPGLEINCCYLNKWDIC